MRKIQSDIYIEVKKVELTSSSYDIGFYADEQGSMQTMCYLLSVIFKGQGIVFGATTPQEIVESFQDKFYAFKTAFVTAEQHDLMFLVNVNLKDKKINFSCDFRKKENENIDFKIMCIQANKESFRIDFNASDDENLDNASCFITMFLRGKGAQMGKDYAGMIYQTFKDAFIQQKYSNVLLKQDQVSYTYKISYINTHTDINCYMDND